MKQYIQYMEKQEISPEKHRKLLDLEGAVGRKLPNLPWTGAAVLAACCLLVLGLWKLSPAQNQPGGSLSQPVWSGGELHMDSASQEGFLVGSGEGGKADVSRDSLHPLSAGGQQTGSGGVHRPAQRILRCGTDPGGYTDPVLGT